MKPKLVIWGASGHALVVADIVRQCDDYEIIGFLDDFAPDKKGAEFCGAYILGGQEQLSVLRQQGVRHLLFGFGDCSARLALAEVAHQAGFLLASAWHPRAVVAGDVKIGAGTMIAAGAVINPGAVIGGNVIINTSASVDHECIISDGAHISPGVNMGCRVAIGRGTWIGVGAVLKDRITIGAGSIVGAGSLVLKDVPAQVMVYGTPARIVKSLT